VDASWLERRLTVDEAEASHLVRDERLGPDPVPFGFNHRAWRELLAKMLPGDELWEYDSPAQDWVRLMGSMGYVLIRPGAEGYLRLPSGGVVASVVCRMN
jgi:hypothetical protein